MTDIIDENAGPTDAETESGGVPERPPEAPLQAILEGLLFASEEPVTVEDVTVILGDDRRVEIEAALEALCREYSNASRGLLVQRIAGGYRITTDPRISPFVREMVRTRNRRRLSRPALETLALIAYKQPVTAPEIQEVRGVNPSGILSTLLDHRLIRIMGRKKVVGKPFVYGTTQDFLIRFGLNSLDDLPGMEEFDELLGLQEVDADADPSGEGPAQEGDRRAAAGSEDGGGPGVRPPAEESAAGPDANGES